MMYFIYRATEIIRNISCHFNSIPNITKMGRVYEMSLKKLNTLMFPSPKIIRKRKHTLQ